MTDHERGGEVKTMNALAEHERRALRRVRELTRKRGAVATAPDVREAASWNPKAAGVRMRHLCLRNFLERVPADGPLRGYRLTRRGKRAAF